MVKVYNFPVDIKNPQLVEQPFSLYQLLHGVPYHKDERTRAGDCYVTGIRFVQNGTQEFNDLLTKQEKRFQFLEYAPEQIESFLKELQDKDRLTVTTNFAAMAHPLNWNKLDGCPYRAFVTDFESLAILHAEERKIAIVPYDGKVHHRGLFYDIRGSKMACVRWQYDGTLVEALTEFAVTYGFDIGRNPTNLKETLEIKRSHHPRDPSRNYIVTDKNIPLENVIEIISC